VRRRRHNTIPEINNLGSLSNLPLTASILEFHIRKNGNGGNKYAYMTEANVEIDP
jgi:hypothetical protein